MVAVGGRAETPVTSSNDFGQQIQQAQAELLESVERAGLGRDPYRFAVAAIVHTLGVFPTIVHRLENAGNPAVIERVEAAAAAGASQRAATLARAHNLRTLLLLAGLVLGVGALGAVGGYVIGRSSAVATVSAVQAAAVRDGPEAAEFWARLMSLNDGGTVAASCKASTAIGTGGRRACVVPAWVEPAGNPAPKTGPAAK